MLKKTDFKIKYYKDRVDIFFPVDETRSFDLRLELFDEIVPENSKHSVMTELIEIQLEKKNKKRWAGLENENSTNEIIPETHGPKQISSKPKPSSTTTETEVKGGPKDWGKLAKEIEAEEELERQQKEEEAKEEQNQGVDMQQFLKIYEKASEEEKQQLLAMMQNKDGGITFNMNKGGNGGRKKMDPRLLMKGKDQKSKPSGPH